MGDAILVQQVTSGGEPTISSWKYYNLGTGYTISVGSHDRVIGLIGYIDNGSITYYISMFQIAQNGTATAQLFSSTHASLCAYVNGSYLGVTDNQNTAFASLTYRNGTLTITQQTRPQLKYVGRAYYCTIDF